MRSTKNIFALLFLFVTVSTFAQSKREWIEYADAAYKNGDYKTAVAFYLKVVDKGTSVDIPVHTKLNHTSLLLKKIRTAQKLQSTHQNLLLLIQQSNMQFIKLRIVIA